MNTLHITDSLPAYALGVLDEPERQVVAKHLADCTACQAELSAYQAVIDRLPYAIPQRVPPNRIRSAILRQALPGRTARPAWQAWLRQPLHPALALIGLLVILALGAANLVLWQQVQQSRAANPGPAMATYRTVPLSPHSAVSQSATGLLVISTDGRDGILVVDGLAPLDATRQYQLWLEKDGQRTNGGVFSVQPNGHATLQIESPLPLSAYQSFGVTIEPFGGSLGPTGDKVLGSGL